MSPARNRVTPMGDIEALALRGAFTGNRGILHEGREIVRLHGHDAWITCALRFKDRWHEQWVPHHYTFLFFHDEAVSFAAGHRPCAECRRADYTRFRAAWAAGLGGEPPSAREMNRRLRTERLVPRTRRRRLHEARGDELPDGAFIVLDGAPHVITGSDAVQWTREGYAARRPRPSGPVTLITPPATVAALRAGYAAQIDPSALDGDRRQAPPSSDTITDRKDPLP
jgi:hypothetical protein